MEIVDSVKFAIGIVFAIVGAILLLRGRVSSGFGRRERFHIARPRQAGFLGG